MTIGPTHRDVELQLAQNKDLRGLNAQWLSECYEYLLSTGLPSQPALVCDAIYEQFLASALEDSYVPSLPSESETIHNQAVFTEQSVVLEVREIHDIGVSTRSLLDRLLESQVNEKRRILEVNEDVEGDSTFLTQTTVPSSSIVSGNWRTAGSCLCLVLSDGSEMIKAIERQVIPGLDIMLPIGTKVTGRFSPLRSLLMNGF